MPTYNEVMARVRAQHPNVKIVSERDAAVANRRRALQAGKICPICLSRDLESKAATFNRVKQRWEDVFYCKNCDNRFGIPKVKRQGLCSRWQERDGLRTITQDDCFACDNFHNFRKNQGVLHLCMVTRAEADVAHCPLPVPRTTCEGCPEYHVATGVCPYFGGPEGVNIRKR